MYGCVLLLGFGLTGYLEALLVVFLTLANVLDALGLDCRGLGRGIGREEVIIS